MAAITGTIEINVPQLPDADFWFINAAAWINYWKEVDAEITVNPVITTVYAPSAYDSGLNPAVFQVTGVDYVVATKDMFDSLMLRLDTLEQSYQNLRSELKDGGLITQAQ